MKTHKACDTILLILRIILGIIFMAHGAQKLFGIFGGKGIPGTISMIKSLGFILPVFFAWILAISEFFGGLGVVLGIFPRISSASISIVMLVAIFTIHISNGFFNMNGGIEFNLLLIGVAISIFIAGAGKFSLYNKY